MCKAGDKNEGNRLRNPSLWVSHISLLIILTSIICYYFSIEDDKYYSSSSLVASIVIFGMAVAYWLDIIFMDRGTNR